MTGMDLPLVSTIKERCRTCFTCVRECPAKAIRIADGQAEVIHERCIGCGNCVQVCSQDAKRVLSSVDDVSELLAGPSQVAAMLAPSFTAEFQNTSTQELVGKIRALGFDIVHEVGFGADLVAKATNELISKGDNPHWISSSCPAIVTFVEQYHPELVSSLLPVVSPMEASARVLRELNDDDLKIVFIGPCIAKKGEAAGTKGKGRVNAALTFRELRLFFQRPEVFEATIEPSDFDPPHAGLGAVFPLSRGLVQTAGMSEDLTDGRVVTADGRQSFPEALREFESGDMDAELLDILCCNGCIMGAGMCTVEPLFRRHSRIARYVSTVIETLDKDQWKKDVETLSKLNLTRDFAAHDRRMGEPSEHEINQILQRMGKLEPTDELNCRACGYDTCHMHAIAIYKGMAESEMCLPFMIEQLRTTVGELHESHEELASTQEQLMHSERLASMGQLAAGIAHEVNNPLGVVLLYAHLLQDEVPADSTWARDLALIADQADRCKGIVAGLLDFARQNKVELENVSIVDLVDKALRSCLVPETVEVIVEHDEPDLQAQVDEGQLGQVLANLVNNAVAAMSDVGVVNIRTKKMSDGGAEFTVEDNGSGIDEENKAKIFEPFFTTKEMGSGTGLGLAVSYGIVKMHHGNITVESNSDSDLGPTGTTFTIILPRRERSALADDSVGMD